MTPQAQELLNQLTNGYKKAAFHAGNYKRYNLPEVVTDELSLPADGWNSGSDSRIFIPVGAKLKLITSEDTYKLGIGGVETDQLKGLWASEFEYTWGK